jgi:hypothetical protein
MAFNLFGKFVQRISQIPEEGYLRRKGAPPHDERRVAGNR